MKEVHFMNITENYLAHGTLLFRNTLNDKTVGYDKDTKEAYRFSLKAPEFHGEKDLQSITCRYDASDRFTPKWVREFLNDKTKPEYINFKSQFPLVVRQRTEQGDVEIDRADVLSGAVGWLALTLKVDGDSGDAVLYAGQFLLEKNGELKNPFADI